jgi:hypothetical protein
MINKPSVLLVNFQMAVKTRIQQVLINKITLLVSKWKEYKIIWFKAHQRIVYNLKLNIVEN